MKDTKYILRLYKVRLKNGQEEILSESYFDNIESVSEAYLNAQENGFATKLYEVNFNTLEVRQIAWSECSDTYNEIKDISALNEMDIEFCHNIRRYGKFIARYDENINGTNEYDDTKSILIYECDGITYYLIMKRGEFIDYFGN